MGKQGRLKDPSRVRVSEHARKQQQQQQQFHILSGVANTFDIARCQLTHTPWKRPCCTRQGRLYELTAIIPYIRKHGCDPIDGEVKLTQNDLRLLDFASTPDDELCDPITRKPFTSNSHIVAIWTSGKVYLYDTVVKLNFKTNDYQDLMTGQQFARHDLIVLHDPKALPTQIDRPLSKNETELLDAKSSSKLSVDLNGKRKIVSNEPSKGLEHNQERQLSFQTTGRAAASLTSSALIPFTRIELKPLEMSQKLSKMYSNMRKQKSVKAFVRLETNLGHLNVMLNAESAPRSCHHFLNLIKSGFYDNLCFHRLRAGFMVQGGYQKDSKTNGEVTFEKNWDDEINHLKHDRRGVVSFSNSDPNTSPSQFFILFAPAPHLNGRHTVFGEVVGGWETLDRIENVKTTGRSEGDKPLEPIIINNASLLGSDPFDDYLKTFCYNHDDIINATTASDANDKTGERLSDSAASTFDLSKYLPPFASGSKKQKLNKFDFSSW